MENEERGILVDRLVQADIQKDGRHFHESLLLLLKFIYLLLGSFGIARAFVDTFQIPVDGVMLVLGIFIICLGYTAIYSFTKKIKFTLPALMIAVIILSVLFREGLADGMGCIFNRIIEQVNSYYAMKVPLLAVNEVGKAEQMISIYLLLVVFIGIMASGIIYYLDARVTALVMTFPFALALAVGLFPDLLSSMFMLIALVGTFFLQYTRQRESLKQNVISIHMGNALFSRLRWQTAAIAAALMLLLIPCSNLVLGPQINKGYESQTELRDDIRNGELIDNMRDFWKKLIRGEWDWLPFDIIRSSGVHGGKLSNIKEIRDYDELHLYLDISNDLKAPLYIRGYVGSNYTGKGWKEQTKEQMAAAETAGMSASVLSQRYFELLKSMQAKGNTSVYGMLRFVITNKDANSDYSYIPYGSSFPDFEPSEAYDTHPEERTDETIMNLYYMNTQKLSNLEAIEKAGKANSGDEAYRQYARDTYLTIPTEGMERFYQEFSGMTFDSIADCVDFVRTTLGEHAVYTTIPGSTPKGQDYVEYFLYENKQGACTHFATAAVMMFRMFGVPARYVEGYLTMELLAEEGPNELMDDCAHAWPEIYIDGAGWVPIEVTPGFINEEDMKDDREPETMGEDEIPDVEDQTEEPTTEEPTTEHPTVEGEFHTEEPTTEEPTTEAPTTKPQSPTTPTKPTEPTQPTTPPSDNNQNNNDMIWNILKILLIVAVIILAVALLVFLFVWQYKYRLGKMEARFAGNPRDGILAALAMIERVSEEEGLLLNENTHWEMVMETYPFVDQATFVWLQSISLEAVYSNHSFEPEVRDDVIAFYHEFVENIAEESNKVKQLYLKYIKCYI